MMSWQSWKTLLVIFLMSFGSARLLFLYTTNSEMILPTFMGTSLWALSQWSPKFINEAINKLAWASFEIGCDFNFKETLPIPTLDLRLMSSYDGKFDDKDQSLVQILEGKYGQDWRSRPLIIKGMWNETILGDPDRKLSLHGLSIDPLELPYFSDARKHALTPDKVGTMSEIIQGIRQGRPYKIGSQEYIKAYPDRLLEVAPPDLIRQLFGNRFTSDKLLGHITSPLTLLRGPLTVPLFAANAHVNESEAENENRKDSTLPPTSKQPFTGLHCEPIGNVAVQLAGMREWTLIEPQHWRKLRPSVSPDSRGFFASWAPSLDHITRYKVRTLPGDAVWVPPWTWHRVDYVATEKDEGNDQRQLQLENNTVATGASLFHFRPIEFLSRNPLFAILLLPYLVGELIGTKTQ